MKYVGAISMGSYSTTCRILAWEKYSPAIAHGGKLGFKFFDSINPSNACRVTIDIRRKTMTINWLPTRSRLHPKEGDILLAMHDDGINVQCGGHLSTRLLLSTSVSNTILPWHSASKLLPKRKYTFVERAQFLKLPTAIKLADRILPITCYTMVDRELAHLGMDVLQHFRLTVDYRDQMVCLEPYK